MKIDADDIITDLWYGNIDPLNGELFKSPETKKLIELISRHREDLDKTMTDEQKAVFEKYNDCNSELNSLSESAIFRCGFKLGAQTILTMVIE